MTVFVVFVVVVIIVDGCLVVGVVWLSLLLLLFFGGVGGGCVRVGGLCFFFAFRLLQLDHVEGRVRIESNQ